MMDARLAITLFALGCGGTGGLELDGGRTRADAAIPADAAAIDGGASDGGPVGDATMSAPDGGPRLPRAIYTYDFGGLDELSPAAAAELLLEIGYVGIVPSGRDEADRERLDQYLAISETMGDAFTVFGVMMPHRVERYGTSTADHRAAIDRMAGREGQLWIWTRDDRGPGERISDSELHDFIASIVDYGSERGVEVVLYPHVRNFHATADQGLEAVDEIDDPLFGLSVNLTHELHGGNGDSVIEVFERARHRVAAVTLSGTDGADPHVTSLDESVYDVRPYLEGIRRVGFTEPVGFLNWRLTDPGDYLRRTMARWTDLCAEVGLWQP